jgi:hypothetical protein
MVNRTMREGEREQNGNGGFGQVGYVALAETGAYPT